MGQPETIPTDTTGKTEPGVKGPSAIDRLRAKAKALHTPRGKYRCRKCRELPCVCEDPKQSTMAATPTAADPVVAPKPLFTEIRTKRLLEAGFGIPTVFTNCKLWALTEDEAMELSQPVSDVLNEFVTVDPKWASLTVAAVSLGSIVARKQVLYSAWKRAMLIQANQQAQDGPPPPNSGDEPPPANPSDNGKPSPGPSVSMDVLR